MPVLLPGDVVPLSSSSGGPIKLGPGLLPSQHTSQSLTSVRPGALGHLDMGKGPESYWVETNTLRYVPAPGDSVIGQITNRGAESYTITLFASHSATLPALSFEGATKRHKPNLKIGQLVYARVVTADRFTEPELTCVDPVTGKAEGFGELTAKEGCDMVWKISLGLARSLLRPTQTLLGHIASHFPFEAAVGHNGMIWTRASDPNHLIAISKVLQAADLAPTTSDSPDQDKDVDAEELVKLRGALSADSVKRIVTDFL